MLGVPEDRLRTQLTEGSGQLQLRSALDPQLRSKRHKLQRRMVEGRAESERLQRLAGTLDRKLVEHDHRATPNRFGDFGWTGRRPQETAGQERGGETVNGPPPAIRAL